MGTKIHCESYLPENYSMRDLNCNSGSTDWALFYGDKGVPDGHYYNGAIPRNMIDGYLSSDSDAMKHRMLEHEAVFKNQVSELHRLYRIQRDMMEEAKRKDFHIRASLEPTSSTSLQGCQMPSVDTRKWHMVGLPFLSSGYATPCISPMSCTKGDSTQSGRFLLQNGSTSKDSEALNSRPLKVRRKLFDLQLPAEEYIDVEEWEKSRNQKVSDASSFNLGWNKGNGLKNSVGLTDLNEPVQIDEGTAPSSIDFLGHASTYRESKGIYQPDKLNAGRVSVAGEAMYIRNGFLIDSSIKSEVDEKEQLSHVYEAGSRQSKLSRPPQSHQQEKFLVPSYPVQGQWKERIHRGLESSDRSRDHSRNSHLEPVVASGSFPIFCSSSFSNSQGHSASSWKPTSTFAQNMTFASSSNLPGRSSQPSGHMLEMFGAGASSRLNPCLGGETAMRNGSYHGSTLGSKEVDIHSPSPAFGYLNCSRGDNVATNCSTRKFPRDADPKAEIDINLGKVLSKSSSNKGVILQDLNLTDGENKLEDQNEALPWLKRKPTQGNIEAADTRGLEPSVDFSYRHDSKNQLRCKKEIVGDLNQLFIPEVTLASSDCEVVRKQDFVETQNLRKNHGVPIYETGGLRNEPSTNVDCPFEGKNVGNIRKRRLIDINLECEPEELTTAEELRMEKENLTNGAGTRKLIDLNCCFSETEEPSALSYESKIPIGKPTLDINLEAPILMESDDDETPSKESMPEEFSLQSLENKNELTQDEVLTNAVEIMLAISCSRPSRDSLEESLLSFAAALSSCANELEKESPVSDGSPKQDFSEDRDDFEIMALQLEETKEEDYMPTSFVPEVQKVEETEANTVPTRYRRGQARRGRPRRDFQRDILPGLTSLSRLEVTEDLQIFEGMMRATGHSWNSRLTRRNGGRRGRKRLVVETVSAATIKTTVCIPLVQQLNNIDGGLEDKIMTGWGKTPRRPRRQRCHAGNPPTVVIT